jgi:DNA repair exonuclease SbcCD ATPase subunit
VKTSADVSQGVPKEPKSHLTEKVSDLNDSHKEIDADVNSISRKLIHEVHCLKYEVTKLKSLMKDQSSNVVIIEEIREEAKSATRQAIEAKDDLNELREELVRVQKLNESAHPVQKIRFLLHN